MLENPGAESTAFAVTVRIGAGLRRAAALALLTMLLPLAASGADAGPSPRRPLTVARRVSAPPAGSPPRVHPGTVIVGDGWGCAQFASQARASWQCWDAGPQPRAWTVTWLKNRGLSGGPDRLCELAAPELAFRCWHRPRRGESEARELPASWQWLNPHGAKWDDAFTRSDRVESVVVGGTFACLQETRHSGVWCLGDDRFGQRGSSGTPTPDAGQDDPAFVRGLWPAHGIAAGTWHACAVAAPAGLGRGAYAACWGRGDHGQLGARAPDRCIVDGRPVPCARRPVRGPGADDGMVVLGAGDLFTCMTTGKGIKCWGANRDGFFGTPGSCPRSLRSAWPTLAGPVAAPKAACSTRPVAIKGASGFEPNFQVAPRALCHDAGQPHCLGGTPNPRDRRIATVSLGSGHDASACGRLERGVVCWGDRYSAPGALDVPVPVMFEPQDPIGETAVVGATDTAAWDPGCLVRRGCTLTVSPLAPCPADTKPRAPLQVLAATASLTGKVVSVRGPLGVGYMMSTLMGCTSSLGRACCNRVGGPVLLGVAEESFALSGFRCGGDDSQTCCNAPAYGQTVVATGRLEPDSDTLRGWTSGWRLADVTLCAPRARP